MLGSDTGLDDCAAVSDAFGETVATVAALLAKSNGWENSPEGSETGGADQRGWIACPNNGSNSVLLSSLLAGL